MAVGIYTKTGDKGTTSLFDGTRIDKDSKRVDTYGTFDELNAYLSVTEKLATRQEIQEDLKEIQYKIFYLSAEVATRDLEKLRAKSVLIGEADISKLESRIDQYSQLLPPVHSFVLPGRSLTGAQLHVARTLCRRAERLLIGLSKEEEIREELLRFVNRLSDCLYMFARMEDKEQEMEKMIDQILQRYTQAVGTENKPASIHFGQVQKIIATAVAKAEELSVPVTITLVDENGVLLGSYRMPGALLVSLELSKKKAYTAVAMKASTHSLQALTQPGQSLYQLETLTKGEIVTFGGGLPFYQSGQIIGGIGVSGGTVEEDIVIAEAGQKFQEKGV